jgi:hypothetical protein
LPRAPARWQRGPALGAGWSRRTPTGETVRPRHLWHGPHGAILPVFLDDEKHVGIGRGRRTASQVVRMAARPADERLALLTNGRQWRLVFAGLDFDAFCESDADLWFEEGELSPQVRRPAYAALAQAFTPDGEGQPAPLLAAVLDSRKGQAELSLRSAKRVREAVELLVQAHGEALREHCADVDPGRNLPRCRARASCASSSCSSPSPRDLLPRDNALYHGAYGIGGLLEELEKCRRPQRQPPCPLAQRLATLARPLPPRPSGQPSRRLLPCQPMAARSFAPATDDATASPVLCASSRRPSSTPGKRSSPIARCTACLRRSARTRVRLRQGRQNSWVTDAGRLL